MAVGIGDVLSGRYELLERLGRGGMAEVFRSRDLRLDREVAVKVLAPHLLADRAAERQLQQEARATAAVRHPGLVGIHDIGSDGETHFIVLELVEGPTLADVLRENGPLDVDEAVAIVAEAADAADAAHAAGLVHRDLKPSNLLLDPEGRVRVTDLGIAHAAVATTSATSTAMLAGSLPYLAPEQAHGDPPTPAVDVYALGCMLMELLTGEPPFRRDTPAAVLAAHLHQEPSAPSSLRPEVPAQLDAVVARALEKDPDRRYPDGGSFARALRAIPALDLAADRTVELHDATRTIALDGRGRGDAAGVGRLRRTEGLPSRRLLIGAATLVMVALVAAGLASWSGSDDGDGGLAAVPSPTPTLAAPSPSAAATPTPSPSPSPSPTPSAVSPEEAAAAIRERLDEAVRAFEIERDDAEDLDDRLAEIIEKHREGKPKDVAEKLRELRTRIDEYARDGAIGENLRADLEEGLDRLEAVL